MESQAAKETEIVFIWPASLMVAIQRLYSTIFHNVTRQIFTSADGMIAEFCHKPSNVGDQIHDPFRIRSLLSYPLQEINVVNFLIKPV